jgi:hypothetical protein
MTDPAASAASDLPPDMRARIEAMTSLGYERWRVMVERIGGCEEPIRLVGESMHVDAATARWRLTVGVDGADVGSSGRGC